MFDSIAEEAEGVHVTETLLWWRQPKSTIKPHCLTVTDSYEEIIIHTSIHQKPVENTNME